MWLPPPFDPLHGAGYQLWSGIGSGSPIFAALVAWWHHNNCVEKGCWRKGHKDPQHGHPTCRKHSRWRSVAVARDGGDTVGRTTSDGVW